jgi:hypothetical protein
VSTRSPNIVCPRPNAVKAVGAGATAQTITHLERRLDKGVLTSVAAQTFWREKMTTLKSLTVVATLLVAGTSLAIAQNGPPTGGQRPVAGGANGGGWGGGWYARAPVYGYGYGYRHYRHLYAYHRPYWRYRYRHY